MGIDNKVRQPTKLKFDFMKKRKTPKIETLSPINWRNVSAGLVGIASLLVAGYLAYANIPERPPNVQRYGYTLEIEPPTYSGNYLTRHFDGRTTVMLVDGFWIADGPYRWYIANGRGIVTEIEGDLGKYEIGKDFAKHPEVFAKAQKDFNEVLKEYKPHIEKFDRDIQMELTF